MEVILINLGKDDVVIKDADRIAQLVLSAVCQAQFIETEDLTDTKRGRAGFGSTGI